jgi:hypothetical protein
MAAKITHCFATSEEIFVVFSEHHEELKNPYNYSLHSPEDASDNHAEGAACMYSEEIHAIRIKPKVPLTPGQSFKLLVRKPSKIEYSGTIRGNEANHTAAVEKGTAAISGSVDNVATELHGLGGEINHAAQQIRDVKRATEDISTYAVFTELINSPGAPRSASSAPGALPGAAPLGPIVENAVRDVLGWKPRLDDPKGFLGALSQSFVCKEVEGHTVCEWTPRTYAVQTDLAGGITGAQASLYKRAQDALDKAGPLLDGLYNLRLEADPQDMEALRAVVRSQMNEFVSELGITGGPRVARANQILKLLLGSEVTTPPDPDDVLGQLGRLRQEFGLRSAPLIDPVSNQLIEAGNLVNSVEEEQNLTNFRILADYLTSLRQSWIINRQFFERPTSRPFFGTQLVLLERQLSVVAESVDEVRFTLDSVFIGPSERQTLEIRFPDNSRMFVEELLSWVYSFATQEGPRLIQDGGKFAVQDAFLPVVSKLRELIVDAENPKDPMPRGYRTPRVRQALDELAKQLRELEKLATPISHDIPSSQP